MRREAARYRSTCAALTQLYGSCRLAAPPVLLVDGYNVMHKVERWRAGACAGFTHAPASHPFLLGCAYGQPASALLPDVSRHCDGLAA